MKTKNTTAYFNTNSHKNNGKGFRSITSLLEHVLQFDDEKNQYRFNKNLSHLSYIIFEDKKIFISDLSESDKEIILKKIITEIKNNVNTYESRSVQQDENIEESKKLSSSITTERSRLLRLAAHDPQIENIKNTVESLKNNINRTIKMLSTFDKTKEISERYTFDENDKFLKNITNEDIKKSLVRLVGLHNTRAKLENRIKHKVKNGQSVATDTVFRIPLQNNVNFDADFLERITVDFYSKYLPDFKTKLICIHQNEYFMSDEEIVNLREKGSTPEQIEKIIIENAKKTAHVQTVIDLYNHTENKYDFTEKKIELINKYINFMNKSIQEEDKKLPQLPTKGKMTRYETALMGEVFQKLFYDFVNKRSKELSLNIRIKKVEELDQSDLTEKQKEYLDRKKSTKKINYKLSNKNFNKNKSQKETIFSAIGKQEEENEIFKKNNELLITERLTKEAELKARENILQKEDQIIQQEEQKIRSEIKQQVREEKGSDIIKQAESELLEENKARLNNDDYVKYFENKTALFYTMTELSDNFNKIDNPKKSVLKNKITSLIDSLKDLFTKISTILEPKKLQAEEAYIKNIEKVYTDLEKDLTAGIQTIKNTGLKMKP